MTTTWFTSDLHRLLEDNPLAAYWNGFIMADGTLTGVGGNRVKVALARKDHGHLESLASWVGKGNVRHAGERVSEWAVQDPAVAPLLREKFDIRPRKTYNPPSRLPFEDSELLTSWTIGFIDGDGHIKNQTSRDTAMMTMNIYLSWKPFLHLLSERLGLGTVSTRSGEYARFTISRHNDLVALKMFVRAHDLPVLARKWDRVDETIVLDRQERADRIKSLIQLGLSGKEIAAQTGASYPSISSARKRMGMPRPGRWASKEERLG